MERLEAIQGALSEAGMDGWLFYDHHVRDPLAYRILRFDAPRTPTRRWFYLIPAKGEPRGLVHRVEPGMLDGLPGEKKRYSSWRTLESGLKEMLGGGKRMAMQYSPLNAIPYVSMVDAGTVELIRGLGIEVVSSADLVQQFEAVWTKAQLESHLEAGRRVDAIRRAAFERIADQLRRGEATGEYAIQQFIRQRFAEAGMITDHGPIVGVNGNASNPHYEPTAEAHRAIRPGDLVLIDLWAKLDDEEAVYYDVTWTGYCGAEPPAAMDNVFGVVRGARVAASDLVKRRIAAGETVCGYEVDDAARGHIEARGFGEYFVHRTGHSIGREVHGTGANMDNLESHDTRRLIAGTCFSVEPGVYLPEFGIRSEVNVYIGEGEARVTGEEQDALLRLV